MRVFVHPTSAIAEPMARMPAGTILKSQPMNGRILVRWSNAHAITVVKSCRGVRVRKRNRKLAISPGDSISSPCSRQGSSILKCSEMVRTVEMLS